MKMLLITAILILTGCTNEYEKRFVCDNHTTPWRTFIILDDGTISYPTNDYMGWTYYKIPDGAICIREKRIKK